MHDYIAKYLTSGFLCHEDSPFSCDANVLGSLLKSSAIIGIWPRPEIPYPGITFTSLATQVRNMEVLDECNGGRYHRSRNEHGVKDTINASIRSLEDQFSGLKLDLFWPKTGSRKMNKKKQKKMSKEG